MNTSEFTPTQPTLELLARRDLATRIFNRIKSLFTAQNGPVVMPGSSGINRREFFELVAVTGAALFVEANRVLPVRADVDEHAEKFQVAVTEREREGFSFPEDLRGNEKFWGNDVLITIDDCANLEYTQRMFEVLNQRGLKATFFPNSNYLDLNDPQVLELWRNIYSSGFEIGYHTTSHEVENFTQAQLLEDLLIFERHMRSLLADDTYSVNFARPPYGDWSTTWFQFIHEANLSNVRWNYVPNSTAGLPYFRAIRTRTEGGGIVLLHPRIFDLTWLEENIDQLQAFAFEIGGRITTLSGDSPAALSSTSH